MTETPTLRDALIDAGMALLEEGGMQGLTLRRAAARAGVSHAAPAHHFEGLPGLMTAIAGRAFQRFVQAMQDSCDAAASDAMSRLHATCRGYLVFAAAHSGLFHVMFVSPEVNRGHPDVMPHSARAYDLLRQACLPFSPDGQPDLRLETAVWSMVHGYAVLGLDRRQHLAVIASPGFAACLSLLVEGRSSMPLAPPDELR
jgi:AcrR family transcriptional regulator